MDQLTAFLQDRWLVVVIAIIALFVVIKIVKTVLKWILVLAIVAGLIYYGSTYTDQLKDIGENVAATAMEAVADLKEKALQGLAGKDAKYKDNGDGTYTITSGSIRLDGKNGSDKVKITIAGVSAEFSLDEALKKAIETAKKNG
ncbi:hypothetical protein FE783_22420 [Paenibacillus mesophilus]|uniref:hypothetical protein n=1 Tax=Paenibacillus mesophilus TaxID=2582849 RepID=UPI00110F618A|nr:hypothetical protein [Paenibacillus mesophilus]TMV47356.1 hypothetical protein FE783_22420 [Paenibacillus mesophilus]